MSLKVSCKFLWFHDSANNSFTVLTYVYTPQTFFQVKPFVWLLCESDRWAKNMFLPSPHLVRRTHWESGSRRNEELGLPQNQLGVADRHHLLDKTWSKCQSWSLTQLCFDGVCRVNPSFTSGVVWLILLQPLPCLYSNNGHLKQNTEYFTSENEFCWLKECYLSLEIIL